MAARPGKTSIPVIGGTWAGRQKARERTMDRQARRTYFDRLCALRETYRELGPDDTRSVISIEAMLERAARLLDRPASPLIATIEPRDHAN
jgi:hypothetical protein